MKNVTSFSYWFFFSILNLRLFWQDEKDGKNVGHKKNVSFLIKLTLHWHKKVGYKTEQMKQNVVF